MYNKSLRWIFIPRHSIKPVRSIVRRIVNDVVGDSRRS